MKKLLSILISLTLSTGIITTVAACGSNSKTEIPKEQLTPQQLPRDER